MDKKSTMQRLSYQCKRWGINRNFVVALVVVFVVVKLWYNHCTEFGRGPSATEARRIREIEETSKMRIEELEESLAKANIKLRSTKLEDVDKLETAVLTISALEQKVQELNSSRVEPETATNFIPPKSIDQEVTQKPLRGIMGHKLVHLDLKGAPPKLSYLIQVFPLFRSWGATGLLIEYEDTFPFSGDLQFLKAPLAYSVEEVKTLLNEAKKNNLEVIPLIQTFGHLEFVLKHKAFSHLRESFSYVNSLCPLRHESLKMVSKLIDQIVALHPDLKWLHVGGDEVWNMKMCKLCTADPRDNNGLFLAHMLPVLKFVKSKGIVPILWDDMMREWKIEDLKVVGEVAEPMVWGYVRDLDNYYVKDMWEKYSKAFSKIWVASSFKGAALPYSIYVPMGERVQNHKSWIKVISQIPESTQVMGVAMTGWSRFDHTGPLCELLPAGLPSLALCLGVLNHGDLDEEQHLKISHGLGFKHSMLLEVHNFKALSTDEGIFPGKDIYNLVVALQTLRRNLEGANKRLTGWFGPYQVAILHKPNFVHVKAISETISKSFLMLRDIQPRVAKAFLEIYPKAVLDEWKYDYVDKTFKEIDRIKNVLKEKTSGGEKISTKSKTTAH